MSLILKEKGFCLEEPGRSAQAESQNPFLITYPVLSTTYPSALIPARPRRFPGVPGGGSGSHCAPPPGKHSMRYMLTTTASPTGLRGLQVFAVAYVDDTQILRFHSNAATTMEPLVPWAKQMGQDFWELERTGLEHYSHTARENLQLAIQIYNQSDDGE